MEPMQNIPWGMRLATDRFPHALPAYDSVELDPHTQTAVYRDSIGTIIEMGKHGTNRTIGTATMSNTRGGDGPERQEETQDDQTTDYESD